VGVPIGKRRGLFSKRKKKKKPEECQSRQLDQRGGMEKRGKNMGRAMAQTISILGTFHGENEFHREGEEGGSRTRLPGESGNTTKKREAKNKKEWRNVGLRASLQFGNTAPGIRNQRRAMIRQKIGLASVSSRSGT